MSFDYVLVETGYTQNLYDNHYAQFVAGCLKLGFLPLYHIDNVYGTGQQTFGDIAEVNKYISTAVDGFDLWNLEKSIIPKSRGYIVFHCAVNRQSSEDLYHFLKSLNYCEMHKIEKTSNKKMRVNGHECNLEFMNIDSKASQ